jgi:hypothetical protein
MGQAACTNAREEVIRLLAVGLLLENTALKALMLPLSLLASSQPLQLCPSHQSTQQSPRAVVITQGNAEPSSFCFIHCRSRRSTARKSKEHCCMTLLGCQETLYLLLSKMERNASCTQLPSPGGFQQRSAPRHRSLQKGEHVLANRHHFLTPSSPMITCLAMSSTTSSGSEHMLAILSLIRIYISLIHREGDLRNVASVLI